MKLRVVFFIYLKLVVFIVQKEPILDSGQSAFPLKSVIN